MPGGRKPKTRRLLEGGSVDEVPPSLRAPASLRAPSLRELHRQILMLSLHFERALHERILAVAQLLGSAPDHAKNYPPRRSVEDLIAVLKTLQDLAGRACGGGPSSSTQEEAGGSRQHPLCCSCNKVKLC